MSGSRIDWLLEAGVRYVKILEIEMKFRTCFATSVSIYSYHLQFAFEGWGFERTSSSWAR